MRKRILISLLMIFLLAYHGCSRGLSTTQREPKIATTIFPLYDITKNVVSDKLEVVEILPAGASPHTYELTPQQVKRLQGVAIVFGIGHGLDDWTNAIVDVLPNVKRVVVDKGIRLRESGLSEGHKEAEAAPHAHGGVNPHYWLSISNGEVIARSVAEEIIQLDPANESHYRANLHAYQSKLVAAKKEIDRRIRDLPNRKIITFHNAWPYYAEEFGLEVVATFEPFPGKQPTPRYLVELHQKTQEHNVTSLFSEPQLWTEAIEPFVSDMGLELYVLDPLGGVEGRNSYIELLEYNTDVIVKALSNE